MQSIREEGGEIGRRQPDPIVSNPISELTQKEKKVILQFRHGEDRHKSGMRRLSIVEERMPGCQEPAAEQVQSVNDPMLVPFCDNVESVPADQLGTSFRIFKDRSGKCWRCLIPLTCDHAIVMEGGIHSCRVRSREINEIQTGLMDPVFPVQGRSP